MNDDTGEPSVLPRVPLHSLSPLAPSHSSVPLLAAGPSNPPAGAPPSMLPALAAAMGAQLPPGGALPFPNPAAALGQAPFLFPGAPLAAAAATAPAPTRPRGRGRGGDDSDRKRCNCKNSRCLKLYCECFASGRYCDGCNCNNCMNNQANEDKRHAAVEAILERNPNAFRPKIAATDDGAAAAVAGARHNKGCNCKKSGCLKKYCECFQAGVVCSQNCKCVDCKNFEGSTARAMLMSGNQRARGERPAGVPVLPPRVVPRTDRGGAAAAPAMTQAQRQQAAKDALCEVVSPEVIEKLTMLLMIIANEEADRRAAAGETEDPEPAAEASVPARSSNQRRASLYDEQERLVLTEIRDTLRTITRVVADKVEKRASAASAKQHAAAIVAAQQATALAQQGQLAAVAAAAAAGRAPGGAAPGVMASVSLPPGVQVPPGMQPMYVVHNNRPQLVFVPQSTLAAAQQQQLAAAAAAIQQQQQAAQAAAAAAAAAGAGTAAPMEEDKPAI